MTINHLSNAIRFLSIDAVQKANSGHPGMPMGMADVATVLFKNHLKFYSQDPQWVNRDRFVLSAGHGSMLLYALLYLTGYKDFTLDEIKNFRQYGSKTAGHPEYGHGEGIETTTGPLGQGLATAVGMAIAEKLANQRFSNELVDHYTYVIAGDGCLMEGISHEAISLAGHLKLNKLIVLWDNNQISIDGNTSIAVSDNQKMRFEASGWNFVECDGHDFESINKAIIQAKASKDKPTLVSCKTIIGFGSPNKQGTEGVHGSPLGVEEIKLVRERLGWSYGAFEIPQDILSEWQKIGVQHQNAYQQWQNGFKNHPKQQMLQDFLSKSLTKDAEDKIKAFKEKVIQEQASIASRKASQEMLHVVTECAPNLIGGSADLTHSNLTKGKTQKAVTPTDFSGSYLHYGVREFGMAAAMNGICLYGGFIPYGGTFLVFTDYCRPAIRLSALMKQGVIYVMTHDSIGLGEDGPTHQPIEHIAALRAIPNVHVYRPCDTYETIECWELAIKHRQTPSILALSRQNLPSQTPAYRQDNWCAKGAYVLFGKEVENPSITFWASGSEVALAKEVALALKNKNILSKVVSVPCLDVFFEQNKNYQKSLKSSFNVVIEAGIKMGWESILGDNGLFFGVDNFGVSAPETAVYKHFGITKENIIECVLEKL